MPASAASALSRAGVERTLPPVPAAAALSPPSARAVVRPTLSRAAHVVAPPIVTSVPPFEIQLFSASSPPLPIRDWIVPGEASATTSTLKSSRPPLTPRQVTGVTEMPNRRSRLHQSAPYDVWLTPSSATTALRGRTRLIVDSEPIPYCPVAG